MILYDTSPKLNEGFTWSHDVFQVKVQIGPRDFTTTVAFLGDDLKIFGKNRELGRKPGI